MRKAIAEIRNGAFAKRWAAEQAAGSPKFNQLQGEVLKLPVAKAEADLCAKLGR